jgi:uncharacterized protein YgiM (DUF1202 family)
VAQPPLPKPPAPSNPPAQATPTAQPAAAASLPAPVHTSRVAKPSSKTDIILKKVYVNKEAANVRSEPDINSARIGVIVKDESLKVIGEKTGADKAKWYKIKLYEGREGWISETVVTEKTGNR